jgi:hypothetical protein
VDVKAGNVAPGVNGGFQEQVKSPMNKGRAYRIPGIGLAGDWPGGWTQTYAQVDTEAGPRGFDKDYFVQQVAGLSQLAGELVMVKPIVIDLGWGELKSALVNLPDSGFANTQDATKQRGMMMNQYVDAFRKVEMNAHEGARSALKELSAHVGASVAPEKRPSIDALLEAQISKLS